MPGDVASHANARAAGRACAAAFLAGPGCPVPGLRVDRDGAGRGSLRFNVSWSSVPWSPSAWAWCGPRAWVGIEHAAAS